MICQAACRASETSDDFHWEKPASSSVRLCPPYSYPCDVRVAGTDVVSRQTLDGKTLGKGDDMNYHLVNSHWSGKK